MNETRHRESWFKESEVGLQRGLTHGLTRLRGWVTRAHGWWLVEYTQKQIWLLIFYICIVLNIYKTLSALLSYNLSAVNSGTKLKYKSVGIN